MNHKLFFLVAVFVALVGIAMMTADTEAGHRNRGNCCCESSCYSCHSCYSSCYGCSGCHGGYYHGCSGCHGCHGGYYHGCSGCYGGHYSYSAAPVQTATVVTKTETAQATPVASRAQFGFRTAQFVR